MEKLKVINLAKSYDRDVPVLRDISFCVDDRDFFVILGPSGCGKTTLLNIIAGVEDINGGEIYIDGIRVNENKPQKRDVRPIPCLNHALVIVSRENWMINTENKKEGKWHSIICKGKSLKKCMFNDIILFTEGMCKGD